VTLVATQQLCRFAVEGDGVDLATRHRRPAVERTETGHALGGLVVVVAWDSRRQTARDPDRIAAGVVGVDDLAAEVLGGQGDRLGLRIDRARQLDIAVGFEPLGR
jgi:hypothetical protein